MTFYKSVNQSIKDVINDSLVKETLCRKSFGRIITLDDVDNGTTTRFFSNDYIGQISVVQRDKAILVQQHKNFFTAFPTRNGHFSKHHGDIVADYVVCSDMWINYLSVDLWNFDFMGTFFGETQLMIKRIFENPSLGGFRSDDDGTLIAFTFQAIANSNLLVKLKNVETWKDRVEEYQRMKSWSKTKLAEYYLDIIQSLCEDAPTCISIEPVNLTPAEHFESHFVKNGIIYGGDRQKDSTMMFVLYRVRHPQNCSVVHTSTIVSSSTVHKGKRKASETECEDIVFLERESEDTVISTFDNSMEIDSQIDTGQMEDYEKESSSYSISTFDEDDSTVDVSIFDKDDSTDSTSSALQSDMDFSESYESSILTKDVQEYVSQGDLSQMELFPHQREMIRAVNETATRGYISAICGSGKTLPMTICAKSVKVSAIFVPFKILVDQIYADYFEHDTSVEVHRVNSDFSANIPLPHSEKSTIYIVNFDSAHRLESTGIEFDLIQWDEAHLTTSKKRRKICASENRTGRCEQIDVSTVRIESKKQIFWTATPNNRMRKHPEIYGDEIFNYGFSEAVNDRIIKSFGIYISCYKADDDHDETPVKNFEKIINLSSNFITNEKCKRVLIYVNRVSDTEELISVENMRKNKGKFPSSFQVDFLSARTTPKVRRQIFDKFKREGENVHILVSCRTISVGVDLPNCDAVVFAGITTNVEEIIQRGCRPCRLTRDEREKGNFSKAKIFFPINTSANEVTTFFNQTELDLTIHNTIRGNPLEIPMILLNLLKKGLNIDFDFDCSRDNYPCNASRGDKNFDNEKRKEKETRTAIPVNISFPYSNFIWKRSQEDFANSMQNLCVHLLKKPCAIPGWEDMLSLQQSLNICDWSNAHNDERPHHDSKDPAVSLRSSWLYGRLRKGYDHCMTASYEPLRQFAWWNQAVERIKTDRPPAIAGWRTMSRRQQADNISTWSTANFSSRPPRRKGDKADKLRSSWINNNLRKGYDHCMSEDFTSLRIHAWWNQAVENTKRVKLPAAITGWEEMGLVQRVIDTSDWSTRKGDKRPNKRSSDPAEKLRASLVKTALEKSYEHCTGTEYEALRIHSWWREAVENKRRVKIPVAIAGWTEMCASQQIQNISDWSIENEDKRPNTRSPDPAEKLRASLVETALKKGYEHCMGTEYEALRIHSWWRNAVENKGRVKIPVAIKGWEVMSVSQRAQNVSNWSKQNEGRRPSKGNSNPEIRLRAEWLNDTLRKNYEHLLGDDYVSLRIHPWWTEAVEKRKFRK